MSLTRQRLLDEAQWAIERGQLDRAARAYRALLDERPEDLRVGLKLGELYLRLEERDAARDLYERLLLRSVQEGAQERAAALAGLLLQISPAHLGARLHLTRAHLAAGDAAGAEGHLGALLEALEAAPGAVALPCLEECARLFPLSRPARQALAERALAAGEGARAAPHCTLLSAWAEREGAAAAAARWAALALAHLGAARAAGLGAALDEAAGASGGGAAGEGAARALTLRRARALRALGRAAESEAPLAPLAAAAPGDLEVALEWAHVHRARARPLQADALLLSVGERALAAGRRPLAREAYEALRAARPDDPAARRALAALESAPPTPAAPPAPAPPWAPEADEGAEADEDAEARDLLRDARAHLTAGRAEHAFELLRRLLAGPHLRAEGLALLIEVATALGEPLLARSAAEAREELLGARGALGGEVVGGAVGLAAALEVMPEGAPEAAPEAALEVMPEGAPEAAPAAPLFLPLNTPIELRLARLISAETRELLRAPEAPPSAPPAPPPAPRLAPSAPPPRLHAEAEELEWPLSARARARRALGEGGGRGLSGAPFTPAPLLPPAGARPPLAEEQPARPPAPAPPQSPPAPPEGLSAPPASPPAPPASPPARPERAPEGAHAGPLLDALLGRLARFAREGDAGGAGVGLDGDLQDLELLLISEGHEGADAAPALLDASFSLSLDEALARGEGLLEALDFSEALSLSLALEARLTPPPGGAAGTVAARGGGARPHRAGGLPLPPLDARLRLLGGGALPPSLDAALALYLAGELELARAALGALGAGRARSYLGALCALELGGLREGAEGLEAALVLALGAPAEARALLYALAADLYDALGRDDECERCLMELLALSPELGAALYALLRAA